MNFNTIILLQEAIRLKLEFICVVKAKIIKFKNKFSCKHLVNHVKINSKSAFSKI